MVERLPPKAMPRGAIEQLRQKAGRDERCDCRPVEVGYELNHLIFTLSAFVVA